MPKIYAGRFDPSFLGIRIRARSIEEAESFRNHDLRAPAPRSVLAMLGDDAFVSDLSRHSVLDHELRHFWDTMLMPFGTRAVSLRISSANNGFLAAFLIKQSTSGANAIPYPLQEWLSLPDQDRVLFMERESARAGIDLYPPSLPYVMANDDITAMDPAMAGDVAEQLVKACRIAQADFRAIQQLWSSPRHVEPDAEIRLLDVWEASALICQFAVVDQYSGEDLMLRFQAWMRARGPRAYRRGLDAVSYCMEKLGWRASLRAALAILTWSQMGAFESETVRSSPAWRLAALLTAAKKGRRWRQELAFSELVGSWDEIADADSFAAMKSANARFRATCRRWADRGEHGPLSRETFDVLPSLRDRMLEQFLDDPDAYVDPETFACREARYPKPCVGLTYSSSTDGRTVATSLVDGTPDHWRPTVSFAMTERLFATAQLGDALFLPGEISMNEGGRQSIEKHLQLKALRLLH